MIKKLSLISLFTLLPASYYYAQTTVFAYVKDAQGNPIERAEIDLIQSENDVVADKIGYFQFVDLTPGSYQIHVTKPGFETRVLQFNVAADEKKKDLGVVSLLSLSGSSDSGVIVIDESMDNDDGGSMQPTVGLLGASRDIFQSVSAFELGAYWFRPRGVDNRYEDVLFNGVSMSKNDDGRLDFSNWGGLNDVTRYPLENADNINPSEYTFGNLGGVVYYNTRASSYRKGTSLSYSLTNRSYYQRLMATYNSGMSKNGWAFSLSASKRWADTGIIHGTYQDSYGYFGSIEKKFSDRFSINLTSFGAPTYRANNSPNTQEVYDLMGKNYNAYWGWQDGEKRNSRIRKSHEPVFQLQFYNKLGKTSNWNNTFSYQFGRDGRSRLDWFKASDPNPTYYRKLPSYWVDRFLGSTSEGGVNITDLEQMEIDNVETTFRQNSQINWDELYNANRNSKDGAAYTMVEDVNKDRTFNWVSHFDTRLDDNWKLNLNFTYQNVVSDNFRRVKDLLGADYANNLNAFGFNQPYDLDNPETKVYEGDRTQFSYDLLRQTYQFNASTEVDLPRWNVVASVFASYSESQRDGHFRHHLYKNDSKGKSEVQDFLNAGMKGKVTYKINGKNFLVYSGAYFSSAPTLNEIFINPRVSNIVTPELENQIVNSNELSYFLRGQILKLRISGYWTDLQNTVEISRYYSEGIELLGQSGNTNSNDAFITEVMSGVDKRYKGLEFGADLKVSPTINLNAVASIGEYTYRNNPNVYYTADNESITQGFSGLGKAQIEGYKVAGTPQKAFSLGFKYNSPKYWWFGASGNYLMDQYLDFSAITRTPLFYTDLTGDNYTGVNNYLNSGIDVPDATPENVAALLKQTKFDGQFMLNANAGKSFLFGKYRVGVSISVNNILDNRDYVTGGFEQGRRSTFRDAYVEAQRETPLFGPKLWYDRGRTYFANVYLRF